MLLHPMATEVEEHRMRCAPGRESQRERKASCADGDGGFVHGNSERRRLMEKEKPDSKPLCLHLGMTQRGIQVAQFGVH